MGLIRGQPRQPWHGTMPMSQPSTPGLGGPGPQTSLRRSMSARACIEIEAMYGLFLDAWRAYSALTLSL